MAAGGIPPSPKHSRLEGGNVFRATHLHRADWFPRAILSGFTATLVMAMLFFVAYGVAFILSGVELNPRRGAETFAGWTKALTSNHILDLAATSMYAAATLHLVIGIVFALLYAYYFEALLPGNGPVKGIWFSLIPWVLSVVAFLPLVGGGFLGANLGAGPLPALGNLVLHLAYGASLGAIYGPLGDLPADDLSRSAPTDAPELVKHYEQTTARGIVAGALVGGIAGVAGAVWHQGDLILGVPPLAFVPLTAAIGMIVGALWGSFMGLAGLAPQRAAAPTPHAYHSP